jgi:hypothetical protein
MFISSASRALVAASVLVCVAALSGCQGASSADEELEGVTAQGSVVLTSASHNVSAHGDSQQIHGDCGDGYHVAGRWDGNIITKQGAAAADGGVWTPSGLEVHGSNIDLDSAVGQQPNGTDANGNTTYQVIDVRLKNVSLIHSHTGYYTYTCNPN